MFTFVLTLHITTTFKLFVPENGRSVLTAWNSLIYVQKKFILNLSIRGLFSFGSRPTAPLYVTSYVIIVGWGA